MQINWFSPLPPVNTGIANYTARLAPTLAHAVELTLWTAQERWSEALEEIAPVRRLDPDHLDWGALNRADGNIFHIGNHVDFHKEIWEVSRRARGVVVLHDVHLHDFFYMYFLSKNDTASYLRACRSLYGSQAVEEVNRYLQGGSSIADLAMRYPMTSLALEGARGAVVHTGFGFQTLQSSNEKVLARLPLPYRARSDADHRKEAERKWEPPYEIIMFAHLGRNRRVDAVLKALARLPTKNQFRLHLIGDIEHSKLVAHYISKLGLGNRVKADGFVSDEQLHEMLSAAHLAINLRYPDMGEASYSLLQAWDYALPALVTRTGWYRDLPENIVAHVSPEDEVRDIQTHLQNLLADPAHFASMGKAARVYLRREHRPEIYVRGLTKVIEAVESAQPTEIAHALAFAVGQRFHPWLGDSIADEVFQRCAEAIYGMVHKVEKKSTSS